MIIERYKSGTKIFGQDIKFKTELFGKIYYWMEDVHGTYYLIPEKDGAPSFES